MAWRNQRLVSGKMVSPIRRAWRRVEREFVDCQIEQKSLCLPSQPISIHLACWATRLLSVAADALFRERLAQRKGGSVRRRLRGTKVMAHSACLGTGQTGW
jgi:hypothetical protein